MQTKQQLISGPMTPAFKESKRQDKKPNQIQITSITYDQNSMPIYHFL